MASNLQGKFHSSFLKLPERADKIKHVLITRTDHIGDLLLTLPIFKALRRALPQAEIRALVSPSNCEVLQECDFVDEVLVFHKDDPQKLSELEADLRSWKCDLAVAAAPRSDDYGWARRSGAPLRVGFLRREIGTRIFYAWFCLTHYCVCDYEHPRESLSEQMAALSELMGIPCDTSLDLPLSRSAREFAAHLQEVWGRPTIAVHLHGRWLERSLWRPTRTFYEFSIDNLSELVGRLSAIDTEARLLFTYGPVERPLAASLRQVLGQLPGGAPFELKAGQALPAHIDSRYILADSLPFQQWAALLGNAQIIVSPDTGAVHLASSLHVPVVAVYLPNHYLDSNYYLFAPWQVPCAKIVRTEAPGAIERIVTATSALLRGDKAASDDAFLKPRR